jgi:hypothetical protein
VQQFEKKRARGGSEYPVCAHEKGHDQEPKHRKETREHEQAREEGADGAMASEACSPSLPSEKSGVEEALFWRAGWRDC